MASARAMNKRFEMIAWGTFFILLGVTALIPGAPEGTRAFGIGLILLGLNFVRYLNGIPTSGFTITLGVIALVFGAAEILRSALRLQVDLPFFPLLLIIIGVMWLISRRDAREGR